MPDNIGVALRHRLQSAQDYDTFDVNIFLAREPAADRLAESFSSTETPAADDIDPRTMISQIQQDCTDDQRGLLAFLEERREGADFIDEGISVPQVGTTEAFWINNSVAAEVSYDTLQSILARPDVAYVEMTRNVEVEELIDVKREDSKSKRNRSSFNDAAPPPTWSVKRINAPLLWQLGITGKDVLVAVIDTGVNYKHPDLEDHMWDGRPNYPHHGYDFTNDDKDPMDEQGHGTATAGQVAGDGAKGSRTGVAPEATIMALRVGGQERHYWKAFQFAIQNEVDVVSMSMSWKLPWDPDYPGWRRACETLLAAGIVHANSIGNQGSQQGTHPIPYNIATPGNCPPPRLHPLQPTSGGVSSAIACGATDDSDVLASYSGRGPAAWEKAPYTDYPFASGTKPGLIKPDVCAPGPGTTSCNWKFPQGLTATPYRSFGGTSAATPHVGGCLALLGQACHRHGKPIIPARMQEALEATAVRINGQARDKENHFGAGRVDVYAAYKYGVAKDWWK